MIDLIDKLMEDFADIIHDDIISFGVGDGWVPLLRCCFGQLREARARLPEREREKFRVVQVKEKLGGLRVYMMAQTDEMGEIICDAERESLETCEFCGSKKNVTCAPRPGRSWIKTLCEKCRSGG